MSASHFLIRPFAAAHRAVTTLRCSFCGKSQHEVTKLVRGPRAHLAGPRIHICDGCLKLCNQAAKSDTA